MLIALFEAQARTRPGGQPDNRRPILAVGEDVGWTDLFATDAKAMGNGQVYMTVQDKQSRHLTAALKKLAAEELISLPHAARARNKYENFLLNRESGRRSAGPNSRYRVPRPDEPHFILPAEVFTKGWIHVLEDSELTFLLMLAYFHASNPDGFRVISSVRLLHMGISRDAYGSHELLSRLGLVSVVPAEGRRGDGTVDEYGSGGPAIPHLLTFLPGGLAVGAFAAVTKAIDQWIIATGSGDR
ncbi:hypothetical protein ACFQZ4_35940 [Catellatospora coxensis]